MNSPINKQTIRVAVGLSGGVDSSVAAYLLQQEGYDVFGLTMQIWDGSHAIPAAKRGACYGPGETEDLAGAAQVCAELGIQHHVLDLAKEYQETVLAYFRSEYLAGRTPNPCLRCNQRMKFGFLLERARGEGLHFDYFATGHYARVALDDESGRWLLRRAREPSKDQSYFLSFLNQQQLSQVLFPLGELSKTQVKEIAAQRGWFALVEKPESQNLVDGGDYRVLFKEGDAQPGAIVNSAGERIGTHNGVINYTIGQRKGLVGGNAEPLYVTALDGATNTVKVGRNEALLKRRLKAVQLNWIAQAQPQTPYQVSAKIRQQHRESAATITAIAEDSAIIEFQEPQRSITPGQAVVLYDQEAVLGSGIIAAALDEADLPLSA